MNLRSHTSNRALLTSLLCGLTFIVGCSGQGGVGADGDMKSTGSETAVSQDLKGDETSMSQGDVGGTPLTCSEPARGWNPNGVHELSGTPQFEGWYYRATDPSSGESWVIITAYWLDSAGVGRSFIELIQGSTGHTYKRVFEGVDVKAYQASPGEFALRIGEVYFSAESIYGGFVDEGGAEINFALELDACAYWGAPKDERNRWTMGWATEVFGPPLKWHVHHLKGEVSGQISVIPAGRSPLVVELSGAPLHQEKNWGNAFPKRWVWLQSNVFEDRPDVAFAAAGGPVFGFDLSPSGYMMGLRIQDRFYNWRTQDGHNFKDVRFETDRESGLAVWTLRAESLRYRADIRATGAISELIAVDVPADGGLAFGAFEHLSAELMIDLYERDGLGWRLVDSVKSSLAAVEAGGEFTQGL